MKLESICPACGRSFKNSHVEMRLFCSVGCQADSLQAQADAIRGEGSRETKHLPPLKPRDARILRATCEHSAEGRFRVHLTEEEWQRLTESYDRIFQDRYDLLTVHTKEGMLASEWLMRTATAERERDEARAELAFIQAEYAGANESDLTRDALCLQVASLRALIREAHRELSTIEAITVSPSDADGLIKLCKRLAAAGKLGAKTESTT